MLPSHSSLEPLESRIAPAVIIVTSLADPSEAGKVTLRDALALADSQPGADTIVFNLPAAAVPGANIIKLGGTELASGGNVTIKGPGAGKLIIDGNNASGVFVFSDNASGADSPVSISGLSIMHGNTATQGGGIFSVESLTLNDVVVSGNTSVSGGGVYMSGPVRATISNSLIADNTTPVTAGGGLTFLALKSISLTKTVVTGNSAAESGGGIYGTVISTGTGIALTGCVISGNTASGGGGGVYLNDFNPDLASKIAITNTKITGNASLRKGALGGGGFLTYAGNTVITGSTISNNTAVYNGGGIYAGNGPVSHSFNSLTISKSTISGNKTTGTNSSNRGGGGVFISGSASATLQPVTIKNSQINDNFSPFDGGGLFAKNGIALSVSNTTFSGNHANGIGGGIATRGNLLNKVDLTVTGGEFSGNTADVGGGISAEGDNPGAGDGAFSMTGSKVTGNTASDGGGVEVATSASVTFKNAVVTGNVGGNYGGGLTITTAQDFHVSGGSISGNFAHRGAGVWAYNSTGSILGTTISGNAALNDGGGVQAFNSTVKVQVAKITGNTAVTSPNLSSIAGNFTTSGSPVKMPKAGNGTFVVTTIADVVDANDGVISLREALAMADLTPGTVDTIAFALPAADFVDGAWIIKLGGTELTSLGNVKIVGPGAGKLILDGDGKSRVLNFDDGDLGKNSPLSISGLSLVNGNATTINDDGGGVFSYESLALKNCTISGCKTQLSGGGVGLSGYNTPDTTASVINCLITGNSAKDTGGISLDAAKSVVISGSTITGNTSTNGTGGLFAEVKGTGSGMTIDKVLISGNTAGKYCGGMQLQTYNPIATSKAVTISNSRITGNVATGGGGKGGGVYLDKGAFIFTSDIIRNNAADYNGGGICTDGRFSSLTITKSTISGNRTTKTNASNQGGGGLFLQGGSVQPVNISKSTIADNQSALDGGGVLTHDSLALTVSKSIITGNHATGKGGGINANTLTVTSSTISGNTAKYGGGLFAAYDHVTVSTSKISGNIATVTGGGVYFHDVTGTLTLQKNTVSGNFSSSGGGLFMNSVAAFAISGGSFTGNSAAGQGGGLLLDGTSTAGSIHGVSITGNAANQGGGIFNKASTAGAITMQIAKVIANSAVTNPNAGDNPGDLSTFTFV